MDKKQKEHTELTLHKPLADGTTTLVFQWDKVTGYTLMQCMKDAKKLNKEITVPALTMEYQVFAAAAATGIKGDDIFAMGADDFTAVTLMAQNFLLGSGR